MANYIIKLIWSINSEKTAAATYQNFLRHSSQFPSHAPFAWLLKGGMGSELVTPLHQHLEKLGCVVQCNTSVTQLLLVDDKPCLTISTVANRENDTACQTIQYDHAVLAVPVEALAGIAFNGGADQIGKTLVESEPSLANLQKMGSVVIPVVDLYLKEKLPDFPKDNIGLAGSTFGLSVLDLSQLWDKVDFGGKTALVVAASDGDSIPSKDLQPQGHAMLRELQEYFPEIKPGKAWGDAAANIDWTKTNVRDNRRHRLFLNDVGSWEWRPPAYFPATLPRIAFAGDFCRNEVDMATIEGAVISGISAARAIQMADAALHGGKERGQPIQAKGHVVYSDAATRAMRQLMLPVAYGALGLAAVDEYIENLTDENRLHQGNHYPLLDYMAVVPLQFTIDWWKGAYWLARSLATRDPHLPPPRQSADEALFEKGRKQDGPTIQPSEITFQPGQPVDEEIGVGAALLMVAGECADYAISLLNDGKLGPAAKAAADIAAKAAADIAGRAAAGSSTSAAADMAAGAIDLAQTVLGTLLAGAAGAAKGAEAYKRRARIKN
ncbi:FAD-dependent oxidoreductase [Sandarakinorhabdus sp.]|uniref:FAD-dependent oxidoreductase n=1 Tax=Sandarakinorhabdus sp. TaxID=1916663 RepID=UPI00286DA5CF|nr:FAD-dependent oxidoreductase [Sandarakinorhabdus sp.]